MKCTVLCSRQIFFRHIAHAPNDFFLLKRNKSVYPITQKVDIAAIFYLIFYSVAPAGNFTRNSSVKSFCDPVSVS